MAGASDQEKTEEPSPRKLEEARSRGEVARSREVAIAMTMLAGVAIFAVAGGYMTGSLAELARWQFSNSANINLTAANAEVLILKIATGLMPVLLPLFGAVFAAALFGNISIPRHKRPFQQRSQTYRWTSFFSRPMPSVRR